VSALFTLCPCGTVQTGTEKVDPARKFKCTTAARDSGTKQNFPSIETLNNKTEKNEMINHGLPHSSHFYFLFPSFNKSLTSKFLLNLNNIEIYIIESVLEIYVKLKFQELMELRAKFSSKDIYLNEILK